MERLRLSLRRLKSWSNEEEKCGGGTNDSKKITKPGRGQRTDSTTSNTKRPDTELANNTAAKAEQLEDIKAKSENVAPKAAQILGLCESSANIYDGGGILVHHAGQQKHEHVRRRSVVTFEEVQKSRGRHPNRFGLGRFRRSSVIVRSSRSTTRQLSAPASADSGSQSQSGILKRKGSGERRRRWRTSSLNGNSKHTDGLRKSVSFQDTDNIRIFSDDDPDDESIAFRFGSDEEAAKKVTATDANSRHSDNEPSGVGSGNNFENKSLVPTFVFPVKRRGFDDAFFQSCLMLETLSIPDQETIVGLFRVNLTKIEDGDTEEVIKEEEEDEDDTKVGVAYTTDGWESTRKTEAFAVRSAALGPVLTTLNTQSYKFVIDCEDLKVGDSIEFYAFYGDHVDSNGQQFYRVSCTKKLNEWAAKAARELKNYAPTVKFNKNYEFQQPN